MIIIADNFKRINTDFYNKYFKNSKLQIGLRTIITNLLMLEKILFISTYLDT